jgi:hypothetical protein
MWGLSFQELILALQTIILLATAVVIWWYTRETSKLRRAAERQTKLQLDAHTFDAITRVHQLLTSPDAILRRRWLYENFEETLGNALKVHPLTTMAFNHALQSQARPVAEGRYDPLENVEGVLADLNVLAISCRLGIEAADRVAKEYEPVIRKTAPFLLTFVQKQRELRKDNMYKREYVALVESFGWLDKNGLFATFANMASRA